MEKKCWKEERCCHETIHAYHESFRNIFFYIRLSFSSLSFPFLLPSLFPSVSLSLSIYRTQTYLQTNRLKTGLKYLKIDVHVDIQTQTDFYVSRQIYRHRFTCGQTDVQTNSLTNKQTDTDRQNHTQADRRNNRHAKIKPYEQADRHRLSNLQAG